MHASPRRQFIKTTAAAGMGLTLGDLAFLSRLRPVSAEETKVDPAVVQLRPEIEPLVRLIETTPRENLLGEIGARIGRGLSYQETLAALQLAGVRNIQPRPQVGFKFHGVLVVNSAHLASVASPPEHRWLPIFWALDYFKSAAAQDKNEGDWTMAPVDESRVPRASKAKEAFITAMDNWDAPAADAAIAGLARTAGANEIYELFFGYGCRDFRSIGHKAIFVANSFRTLQCIGWQHAEPILRSLAYALLMHEGENPSKRDGDADRPGRRNHELAAKFPANWLDGKPDDGATREVLQTLRTASTDAICDKVVELIGRGVAVQSIWDGLFVGAGELLMRQAEIVALHAVTTTNALRFAFDAAATDETRRMALLQAAAFLTLFREAMGSRGRVRDLELDRLVPEQGTSASEAAIEEILADVGRNKDAAAKKVLAFAQSGGNAADLIQKARTLVFFKGTDSHDYKFSSAALEDYYHVSPSWRDRYLAASVFKLRGSTERDTGLVERTKTAFKG